VPIPPLAELGPLAETDMQAKLQLDAAEIATESPARHALTTSAHIWVGGIERPAFVWQARTLSESWNCAWTVDPGSHLFSVIDALEIQNSALMNTCLDNL